LAYGNNHLYLVSRNGGDFIRILDAQTGADLGALNLGTGVVSGGTFDDMLFSASDQPMQSLSSSLDAAIYGTNFILSWPSVSGQLYQIEYKDDLGAANWPR
jgi:hypothetical protein